MRALVLGDNESITSKVQEVLLRTVFDCPSSHVMRLDLAENGLAQCRPELVAVGLSPDPQRAIVVMGKIRGATRAHIIAVGPAQDPKLILRTLREGADEFLDEAELENELGLTVSRLATMKTGGKPGRIFGVLAPSGGSGSSTIAVNLATALAKQHQSSALLDLKLGTDDIPSLLNLKPIHSLTDLCQNLERLDRSMFEQLFIRHASGVHLLAAPSAFADIARVTRQGVRQALMMSSAVFPYVVVDLDRTFREEQLEVIQQADELLLVLRLEVTSVRNTARTLEHLGQYGVGNDRLRLVANRYGQSKELPIAAAEEALGMKVHFFIPDDPSNVLRANNKGVPVILDRPWASVSRKIKAMATSLNGLHEDR